MRVVGKTPFSSNKRVEKKCDSSDYYCKAFQSKIETEHLSAYTKSRGRNRRIRLPTQTWGVCVECVCVSVLCAYVWLGMMAKPSLEWEDGTLFFISKCCTQPKPICSSIKSCVWLLVAASLRVSYPLKLYNYLSDEGSYSGLQKIYIQYLCIHITHYNGM